MNREALRQLVQDRYGLDEAKADQLIDAVQHAAVVYAQAFQAAAESVRQALIEFTKTDQFQQLRIAWEEMQARQTGKTETYYRSRLPADQGYNRTEFDRWRNNLGGRRGKRRP